MIKLKDGQKSILIANILAIIIFTFMFLSRGNFEFVIYVGVIIFFMGLILFTNDKVNYPNPVLWALTLWSILHMAGGGIIVNGFVLYKLMIINLIGEPYLILKYDQVIHFIGFFAATLLCYYILRPQLKKSFSWKSIFFIVVMAGLGLGALNEIVEFTVTVLVPETNVGGYVNTALDLVFDLLGSIFAMLYIYYKER